jgi:hypothetical protein
LNDDRNNIVFIQDQGLARVYKIEFEEMWGGSGAQPVPANSKFGPDKTDNTPHVLNVGGKIVECYFSPSDDTNNQLLRTLQSANTDMQFATMVFTRFDLAYGVEERVDLHGVQAYGIMDDSAGGSGTSFLIMQGAMGNKLLLFDHASNPGILHHKYLIVDHGNSFSDPLVWTGSHNWSSAANLRNDENTIVIHDPLIVNQFYQEFHNLYNGNGGSVGGVDNTSLTAVLVYPNPVLETLHVEISSKTNETVSVFISDITGKIVLEEKFSAQAGINNFELDAAKLDSGIYFVNISSSCRNSVFKFMVQ